MFEIDGVELEESGGSGTAGSHWEARILLGEYMNGVIYPEEQVISEFTLAVLEDTGYYKANYYTGGLMRYGKNKGCDFIKKRCVDSNHEINPKFENEFFNSIESEFGIEASCSSGRQSRTYYTLWEYQSELPEYYQYFQDSKIGGSPSADYCPVVCEYNTENQNSYYTGHCSLKGNGGYGTKIIYRANDQVRKNAIYSGYRSSYYYPSEVLYNITGEAYSDHSFCYLSTLIKNKIYDDLNIFRAICYESFCSDRSLTIKINEDYIVCPRAGGKIEVDGYQGYFLCPDYNLICSGTVICNDMFDCVDKKSEVKEESYYYDYKIKTSQNIGRMETILANNKRNYELSENGICPINCKHCLKNNKCLKCREGYSLVNSNENEKIICLNTSNNVSNEDKKDFDFFDDAMILSNKSNSYNDDGYSFPDFISDSVFNDDTEYQIDKKPFFQLFILQVRLIDNYLKIYATISIKIDKEFHIEISIDSYTSNRIRNLQSASLKDHKVDLYLEEDNDIEPGKIFVLTCEERFENTDRILVNLNNVNNNEYEIKILNNDSRILDTKENEIMIKNNEIIDFSKNLGEITINNYLIKTSSIGCEFNLNSNKEIQEQKKDIVLNFQEENNKNNIVSANCVLSSEYKSNIPCSFDQEVTKRYNLDSIIGSNDEKNFFLISQEEENECFEINCQNKSKKSSKTDIGIIIIIIGVLVVVIIIVTIFIVICCKREQLSNIGNNNRSFDSFDNGSDSEQRIQDILNRKRR